MKNRLISSLLLASLFVFACACTKNGTDPDDPFADDPVTPEPQATIYGRVKKADGTGVGSVIVTDGVNFTKTNGKGVYNLRSDKKNSIVFITIPAYYRVPDNLSQPHYWETLTKPADEAERHDFILYEDPGQDSHTRFVFGDIHFYCDKAVDPFDKFRKKVNAEAKSGVYRTVFGLTLGDMTWDLHWYGLGSNSSGYYGIPKYLEQSNKIEFPMFCTVGNHDHDMKTPEGKWLNSLGEVNEKGEDWSCEIPFRRLQGPTCYSTNIGKVHYVSVDDAITTDDGTGLIDQDHRNCVFGFTEPDLEWLKNDLSYVPKTTPIVLTVHIPLSNRGGTLRSPYASKITHPWFKGKNLGTMLEPFAGRPLLVISAHTHYLFINENLTVDTPSGQVTFTEINNGAVCGNFWGCAWKGYAMCVDGTPGGYRVLEYNGTKLSNSMYQPYEKKGFYPFRSYDRNQIEIKGDRAKDFSIQVPNFMTKSTANLVYIHCWDYCSGWTIKVTEDGKELPVKDYGGGYDPLYMLMLENGQVSNDPGRLSHLFEVQASSPTSTLVISVTDPYGHTAIETMTRPKVFKLDTYRAEDYSK